MLHSHWIILHFPSLNNFLREDKTSQMEGSPRFSGENVGKPIQCLGGQSVLIRGALFQGGLIREVAL